MIDRDGAECSRCRERLTHYHDVRVIAKDDAEESLAENHKKPVFDDCALSCKSCYRPRTDGGFGVEGYKFLVADYLIKREGSECKICGKEIDEGDFSIDHIMPVSKKGSHSIANFQLAHKRCNKFRGKRGNPT